VTLGRWDASVQKGWCLRVHGHGTLIAASPFTGTGQSVGDPATMLGYGDRLEVSYESSIEVPGEGSVPASVRETKKTEYTYQSPGGPRRPATGAAR